MSEDGPTHFCVNANSCADEVGCRNILTFQSSQRETGTNLYRLEGKMMSFPFEMLGVLWHIFGQCNDRGREKRVK